MGAGAGAAQTCTTLSTCQSSEEVGISARMVWSEASLILNRFRAAAPLLCVLLISSRETSITRTRRAGASVVMLEGT